MWSKTRQVLRERLADSLKYRVDYFCFAIRGRDGWSHTFGIDIDNDRITIANICKYYSTDVNWDLIDDYELLEDPDNEYDEDEPEYYELSRQDCKFNLTGISDFGDALYYIHKYLNYVDMRREFKTLVEKKKYVLVMFGILDRRVGRRSIQWLNQRRDTLPEWMYRFIDLRIEAEGWNSNKTEREG
jgi:hypothetical protein